MFIELTLVDIDKNIALGKTTFNVNAISIIAPEGDTELVSKTMIGLMGSKDIFRVSESYAEVREMVYNAKANQ